MHNVIVRVKWYRILLGCSLLLPLLYACSAPSLGPSLLATPSGEEEPPSPDYIIGSEDAMEVQVWKNLDLSRAVTVRPDGKISLPLIGDVPAAGQTAAQLAEAVTEKLRSTIKSLHRLRSLSHKLTVTPFISSGKLILRANKSSNPGRPFSRLSLWQGVLPNLLLQIKLPCVVEGLRAKKVRPSYVIRMCLPVGKPILS